MFIFSKDIYLIKEDEIDRVNLDTIKVVILITVLVGSFVIKNNKLLLIQLLWKTGDMLLEVKSYLY